MLMPIERETIITNEPAPQTVVSESPGSAIGGVIAAIIGAIVLVLLVLWLLNGGLNFSGNGAGGGSVKVDLPNVSVTK
jgi:hypothetical protein